MTISDDEREKRCLERAREAVKRCTRGIEVKWPNPYRNPYRELENKIFDWLWERAVFDEDVDADGDAS